SLRISLTLPLLRSRHSTHSRVRPLYFEWHGFVAIKRVAGDCCGFQNGAIVTSAAVAGTSIFRRVQSELKWLICGALQSDGFGADRGLAASGREYPKRGDSCMRGRDQTRRPDLGIA